MGKSETTAAELAEGAAWIRDGKRLARELRKAAPNTSEALAVLRAMSDSLRQQEPQHPDAQKFWRHAGNAMAQIRLGNTERIAIAMLDVASTWYDISGRPIAITEGRRRDGAKGGKARSSANAKRDAGLREQAAALRARNPRLSNLDIAKRLRRKVPLSEDRLRRIVATKVGK